jgi:UDP-3-O-[3-hydroxymyristoyl] glucosamine N-acyltransferase
MARSAGRIITRRELGYTALRHNCTVAAFYQNPGADVSPLATVQETCIAVGTAIMRGVTVEPFATIRGGVKLGEDCVIQSGARIGNRTAIGRGANIGPGTRIGQCSAIGSNSSIGADCIIGFGVIVCHGAIVPDGTIIPDEHAWK